MATVTTKTDTYYCYFESCLKEYKYHNDYRLVCNGQNHYTMAIISNHASDIDRREDAFSNPTSFPSYFKPGNFLNH